MAVDIKNDTDDIAAFLVDQSLPSKTRQVARLFFSGRLSRFDEFDENLELGKLMCRRITSDLNSTLLERGFVGVIDFPSSVCRIQVLTSQAYLRTLCDIPTIGLIEQMLVKLPISTRLIRSTSPGALDFQVRMNYGHDLVFSLPNRTPENGFALVTSKHSGIHLLLDAISPKWRVYI